MEKAYKIITDQAGVVELANYINNGSIISYDTETTSVNPRTGMIIGFSVSADIGEGYYFPTRAWDTHKQELVDLHIGGKSCDDIAKHLISMLKGKKLVMHNGSFDIRFTKNFYGIDLREDLYCDTMLLTHTLKEDGPFGLKTIAIELQEELGLNAEKEANEEQILMKENIKKNGGSITKENYELFKADMELLGNYAAADTDLTLRVMTYFLEKLKEENLWDFFFTEEVMPLYRDVTIGMEEVGTELDIDLIQKTKISIAADMKQLEQDIVDSILKTPQGQQWVLDRAMGTYKAGTKGRFAQKLLQFKGIEMPTTKKGTFRVDMNAINKIKDNQVRKFLSSGDVSELEVGDHAAVCLEMWKEDQGNYINISSKQQLAELCFQYYKIKPISKTRKGTDQFNDDLIEEISKKYDWASKLRDYNKLIKISSSYIDRFLDNSEDGRYYFYFKQHGTTSGRYSSDSQQLPRILEPGEASEIVLKYNNIVRNFIIAGEGKKLVICDQSSLEPRVFACVSNDPNLINVFLDNEDLYSRVAIQAFKLRGMSAKKDDDNYVKKVRPELRQRAKSIALAIPYGAGAWQIGQTLGMDFKEAQRLIDGYLDGFPELAKWMSDSKLRAQTFGYVTSKTGRIRHLDRVKKIYGFFEDNLVDPRSFKYLQGQMKTEDQKSKLIKTRMEYKNGINNSRNFQIQSLAASIMNRSAIAIHKDFKEKGLDAYIMLQIHDEFVLSCNENIAQQVSDIVKHHMENTVKIETGLVAEPNITDNFGEGHA